MLAAAFNALTRLHSRQATLKRLGSPDIYSPCRVTPSNFFRFLRGPEYTEIKGVEFVIPLATLVGEYAQFLFFSAPPDAGTYQLKFNAGTTDPLNFDASQSDVQSALRALTGLEAVEVVESDWGGFQITFKGYPSQAPLLEIVNSSLTDSGDPVTAMLQHTSTAWEIPLKRGDRILESNRTWTIDEVIELNGLGAALMGYRVRAD